jgi:alkylation response protein AidB-like acyl-CoA dehydrogenase
MVVSLLFLRHVAKNGTDALKQEVLPLFAQQPLIGGFALTEPGCGSAMSRMTTSFEEVDGGYRIRGQKHWQAFSGRAHWWVVSARHVDRSTRRYAYFVVKRTEGFKTVERYNPLGLKLIDYGLNEIDAFVPKHRRLQCEEHDLSGALEMLCPPRISMAALASGFLKRINRDARARAEERRIGPVSVADIGYARYRLKWIESSMTLCEAACRYLEAETDLREDMMGSFFAVQAIKTLCTDRMLASALHYQQLCGGEGYRFGAPSNIAAQAALDARVFPIFDGNNDLLNQQLAEHCLRAARGRALSEFLAAHPLTGPALPHADVAFLDRELTQPHQVLAGRAIATLFGMTQVMKYTKDGGPRARRAIEFLKADLRTIAGEMALLDTGCLTD